jgi:hypothetical protein
MLGVVLGSAVRRRDDDLKLPVVRLQCCFAMSYVPAITVSWL